LQKQPTDLARPNSVVRRDLRSSNYLTNMAFGGLDIGKRRSGKRFVAFGISQKCPARVTKSRDGSLQTNRVLAV
jgi:hypothetical protein